MPTEAGLGKAMHYHIQNLDGDSSAPFEVKKHYLRIDAVSWFINKESNFWKTFIASGILQIKLANETYEIGLGTYKLDAGMKTAPIFNRPIIDDRVYEGGGFTVNVITQAIKKDTLLSKILKDLGNSTVDIVTGAIQGASNTGPSSSLLSISKGLTNNIKDILNEGDKKVEFFNIEGTFPLNKFQGNENYILLHRGMELSKDKLKIESKSFSEVSLTYEDKALEDGAWLLLRVSRIDRYEGVRPWYSNARSIRADIDRFMDAYELEAMSQEDATNQLTPSDNDPNRLASKVLELISIIRNDFVLSYRDALVETSMYKNLLQAARSAVILKNVNEYKKIRDKYLSDIKIGQEPDKLLSSIIQSEFKNLSFRDELLSLKASGAMEGDDLWRSIRHTHPVSLG